MTTRRDLLRCALGAASLGAGAVHLALGPAHMREWAVLGLGFYAAGALQLAWGVAVLRRERLLATGALGSVLFVAVWLVSRTTGLPVGPSAGRPEALGLADQLCVALEAVVALGALLLLARPSAGRAPAGRLTARAALAGTAIAVLGTTATAVAAPGHGHGTRPCTPTIVAFDVDENGNGVDDGVEHYFACQLHAAHEGH